MGIILALSGALPALFFMWYVETHDAQRPEPKSLLRRAAIYGGLATIPCALVQFMLMSAGITPTSIAGALSTSYVLAATVEESAKALCLYVVIWRHPAFDEYFDGIIYGTRVGLGFALVENIGYLFQARYSEGFIGVFIMRAVLAVPLHAICGGFIGHYAAKQRFGAGGSGIVGGLTIAILMHGTYDAALFLQGKLPPLISVPLLLAPQVIVFVGHRRLRAHAAWAIAKDDHAHGDTQPVEIADLPPAVGFVLR